MKLSILRNSLKEATAGFAKIIAGHPTLAILGCVRFDAAHGTVTAETTNLDETARYRFPGSNAAGDGTLILPLQTLKDLCKGGAHDVVELESASDDAVVVTQPVGGHLLRRTVAGFPVADWPATGDAIPTREAQQFLPTYRRVAPFSSSDSSRPVLNTVFADISGKGPHNATLVATDGRRLTACNSLSLPLGKDGVAVPVTKFLTWPALGDESSIGVAKTSPEQGVASNAATWFALDAGPWSYKARTPAGAYPNWRQVLPSGTNMPHRFVFTDADVDALRKLLPAFPGGEEIAVLGEPMGKTAVAGRNKGDSDDTRVDLAGGSAYEGAGARLMLNRHFLLDALNAGFRNFGFEGGVAPLLSADTQGGIHVLMPLRMGRETAATPTVAAPKPEAPLTTPAANPAPNAVATNATVPATVPTTTPTHQPPTPKETPMTTEPETTDASPLAKLQAAVDLCKARVREANQALVEVGAAIKDAVREDRQRRNEVESVGAGLQKLQAIRV